MGMRISEYFLEFFVGISISLFPLGFFRGIINYESYNKKVPKEHCSESSLFDGIRKKTMSKSPKLHGRPILFVTNCLYPSE